MSDLAELYQEMILDMSQVPLGFGELPNATHKIRGYNPLCGDDLSIEFILRKEPITGTVDVAQAIEKVQFTGQGCAISKASASVLTKLASGSTAADAQNLAHAFGSAILHHKDFTQLPLELQAFSGVSKFPMRVKCATLAWHALQEVLQNPTAHERNHQSDAKN